MSKTLFDEAVADANKLREVAEETAKNKVVEAVMPQIRDLINRKILGEEIDLEEFDLEEPAIDDLSDEASEEESSVSIDAPDSSMPGVKIDVDGDVDINIEFETEVEEDEEDELVVDQAVAEALSRLINGPSEESTESKRITKLSENVQKLSIILETIDVSKLTRAQNKRLNLCFVHCVREAMRLKSQLIITENTTQERLERRLTETIKEIRKMSKSNRRNIFDFLFEGEDAKEKMEELEEAELSLELSADEQEELAGAEDADSVADALEDILGDIELSLDAEGGEEEGEEAEEAEEEDEEEGGEEEAADELDLEEGEEKEEGMRYEGEMGEMSHKMEDSHKMEETYEIDENMLRRELARLTEEAVDEIDQFGGAEEVVGDVLLDVSEEDLINALADELGSVSETRTRRTRGNKALTEARKEIRQYKRAVAELKGQLVEMNLFNAKLLYANKLMQNKDLTVKQQKAIVEALDNAKTLREAKLLFKSLTESLNRRANKSKLTEGSLRTRGTASKTTRSSSPTNNNSESDRWAVLAGLSND